MHLLVFKRGYFVIIIGNGIDRLEALVRSQSIF